MLRKLFRKLAGPDRQLADELEAARLEAEGLGDEIATYRHLITALLLAHGDTVLSGPRLAASANLTFRAEHTDGDAGVELILCD